MNVSRIPRRRVSAWAAATLAAVLGGSATVLPQSAAASPPRHAQVDAAVLDAVSAGEQSRFFVVLKDQADLSAAKKAKGHGARAKAVFDALRTEAADSQKPLRSFLDRKKVGYESYWIANTLLVTTADKNVVEELAARADVAGIVEERAYRLDDVETSSRAAGTTDSATPGSATPGSRTAADAAGAVTPEWGVADIRADQVWDQYQAEGEGVVIANVDSGVQWDHPALKAGYRGWNGTAAHHDYNFYDPSGRCGTGGAPCDNTGHGTHTMGTMAGSGGIGVAPGARWIAAKGCADDHCYDGDLLAAGQWILAPTDRNGDNPRPDLAPNIVNNSWGGGNTDFYQDIVDAWNAAGIFEAFANGNDGDGVTCSTARAPGAQGSSYAVGSYDSSGRIATTSGFGPSLNDGSTKPNIAAPGVNIRSAWPGGSYNAISGTSMATPHVAGTVALLWSEAPSLIGDIDATRALLNETARDVADTHCGGTAGFNNVWGEGKLDALAAVDAAPHTKAVVTGKVTDKDTGAVVAGATVTVKGGDTSRSTVSRDDGTYRFTVPAGSYTVTTGHYGYTDHTTTYEVAAGENADRPIAMTAVPHHAVTGTVLDAQGAPLAGATVEVIGAPVDAATTRADGTYTLPDVAEGSFGLGFTPPNPARCNGPSNRVLTVDGAETADVRLPRRTDASGTTTCAPAPYGWIKGRTTLALSGDEDATGVRLPFPVDFYGVRYTSLNVTTNGLVNFLSPRLGDLTNTDLPNATQPNGIIAAYWDDLVVDKRASVQTAVNGTVGQRTFAVVWNNAASAGDGSARVTFEAVFDEATGAVTLQYADVAAGGASATVGVENQAGTDGFAYSFDRSALTDGTAIRFTQGSNR
ncbi:S8 family serine peptidase [Streptomyces sp. NPDC014773]|uniref:S8 family serine peptidase n=1 Tax=Streptomyces sp. NPDC014773 TaxID=3364908 RepID=UPI0036FF5807